MSSCLTPQTQAERPPFRGGPPVTTTFDSGFSGESDPDFEPTLESAERLLKSIPQTTVEAIPVTLRLLIQRCSWLEAELWARRSLSERSLPPIRGFELDPFLEPSDNMEVRFVRMIDRLKEAIEELRVKMDMQQCPFPLPEL